jgi:hypothetical protein
LFNLKISISIFLQAERELLAAEQFERQFQIVNSQNLNFVVLQDSWELNQNLFQNPGLQVD